MEITRNDTIRGAIGLITGGPVGLVLSPAIGRLFNSRWTPWALSGIVLGPLSWAISTVPIALLTYNPSTTPTALPELKTTTQAPAASPQAESNPSPGFPAIPPPSADPAPRSPATTTTVEQQATNTGVADNLNSADQMFANNMDGCSSVSTAAFIANNPNIYGPTSDAQRSEIKRYAQRCNLRF